jgi:hypothetical protein
VRLAQQASKRRLRDWVVLFGKVELRVENRAITIVRDTAHESTTDTAFGQVALPGHQMRSSGRQGCGQAGTDKRGKITDEAHGQLSFDHAAEFFNYRVISRDIPDP